MILFFACLGALALAYLVITPKVKFPLLFDSGLCLISLSMLVWADKVEGQGTLPTGATVCICIGFGLLLASAYRQKKQRQRTLRKGPPVVLEGALLSKIQGGKHR